MTRACCEKLIIDAKRCKGVRYRKRNSVREVHARREVILSAGVIGSPKLLMLSGIGDGQHLKELGVDVEVDRADVGANLTDHPEGMVGIDVNVSTYNTEINSWKIVLHSLNWLIRGRGPATSPYPHAVAFLKSDESLGYNDIQVQLGPYAFSFSEEGVIPYDRPAISAAVNIAFPENSGSVRLRCRNAKEAPRSMCSPIKNGRIICARPHS